MMKSKIAVCPICGKRTCIRVQDGSYLNEYPIRVHCMNCRALLKGTYVMSDRAKVKGLVMYNAETEECEIKKAGSSGRLTELDSISFVNVDYIAEVSGELPCKQVHEYHGGYPISPFLRAVDNLESFEDRIIRLTYFSRNMEDWNRTKSIAFQLLDEGSIEYISKALKGAFGNYRYKCDHYLKSIHCLQEVVLDETKYLFLTPCQDDYISDVIQQLSQIEKEQMHQLSLCLGGIEELMRSYRKAMEVFSSFMGIYANILPAETYMRFKNTATADNCISTCSFSDLKTFYQDAYESLISLLYIPVCLDNIVQRGDFQQFDETLYNIINLKKYRTLPKGSILRKLNTGEYFQRIVNIPANKDLRNGIGHNNIKYDGITQIITVYDIEKVNKVTIQIPLMNMALDCIGLTKSAVIISEIILFLLREEFRLKNITTLIHPRFYKNIEPNMKCPCGSNRKYKKCCRDDYELLLHLTNN